MTYTPASWACNGCGERVSEREMVTLFSSPGRGLSDRTDDPYRGGWIGHYHEECWYDIREEVQDLARAEIGGPDDPNRLAQIPVIRGGDLARLRRMHRLPDGSWFGEPSREIMAALGQDRRAAGALADAGITSPEMVARMTDDELLAIRGVGPTTVRRLRESLERDDAAAPTREVG